MASARRKVNTTQDEDDSYWNQSSTFKRFNFNDDIVESDSIDIITWGGDAVSAPNRTQQNVAATPPRPISSSSALPTSARQHPSRRKIADHLPQPTSSLSSSFNKGGTNLQRPEVKIVGGATEMAKLKTEIEMLKDQVDKARKDRSSAPSCDQTLQQMMIGEPYVLELYKSKEDKCEILDKAIERFDGNAIVATTLFMRNTLNRELFSKQLMSRPVAVDHYCAYLRASDETDELYETLSSLIKSEEAAILKYKKTLSSTSNSPQIRSSSLKECIKYNFDTDRQLNLEKNMIHEQILLINNQLIVDQKDRELEAGASSIFKTIPWKKDLINQSVISTLFYCCCYHWDDNSNPASPHKMMERHKISKKQFQFIAVAAHCLTRRYRELEKMLTIEKSLFRSAHLSSVIGIDKVVDILSKYNSPPDVLAKYCYSVESVERKLELAKKHKCYKIAVDTMIAMKNRSDLLAYLYTIPDSHQFLRKQVDEMLKSSQQLLRVFLIVMKRSGFIDIIRSSSSISQKSSKLLDIFRDQVISLKNKHKRREDLIADLNQLVHPSRPTYVIKDQLRHVSPYFRVLTYTPESGRHLHPDWFSLRNASWKQPISRERIRQLCLGGKFLLNFRPVDSLDIQLKRGHLLIYLLHKHEPAVNSAKPKILFEDENLVVVDKPPGVPITGGLRYYNTLAKILEEEFGYNKLLPVHRLDLITSGVQIFAKTTEYVRSIQGQWKEVRKSYVAKVVGEFPEEETFCRREVIASPIQRGMRIIGDQKSTSCITRFNLLQTDGRSSLVRCFPETGRTHQIRVHLQHLGFPIIGDPLYNKDHFDGFIYRPANKPNLPIKKSSKTLCSSSYDPYCEHCLEGEEVERVPILQRFGLHAESYHLPQYKNMKFSSPLPKWAYF